jgi:hypothetical protein
MEEETEEKTEELCSSAPKATKAPPGQPDWCQGMVAAGKGMSEAAESFKGLGQMLKMRERDNLYGESRESREYFMKEHEKNIAKGFPTTVKKCIEVAGTEEEFLVHSVPEAGSWIDQNLR